MIQPAIIGLLARRISAWSRLLEPLTILTGACFLSLIFMPDNNWDLRNYHIYNAFALMDGRISRDLFAAGDQSYFNPLLDVPYYILSVKLIPGLPRVVAFLSGVPFGIMALVTVRAARITLPAALPRRNWFAAGAAALGLTGTAGISEIGTTFGDIPVACLVLGGLTIPLALLRRDRISLSSWIGAMSAAGFLIGLASGLKPVACVLVPGAALGLALTAGGIRRFVLTGVVFSLSWTIGFALAFGPWGLTIYRLFGNPVFPLMNHIFESPWIRPVSAIDSRFLPKGIWQTLFYPFFWLRGQPFVVAEFGVRDPRFALSYLSLGAIIIHMVRQRGRSTIVGRPAAALCIFFSISFVAWEAVFSILRYALVLEVTSGILITLSLLILTTGLRPYIKMDRGIMALAGAVLIVVFAVSSRPGWGRLRQYGSMVFDVQESLVPDHSAVVFVTKPTAFIAPFLKGNDLTFIGLEDIPMPSRLSEEAARRIQSHPHILAVLHSTQTDYTSLTRPFGFRIVKDLCVPIHSANQRDLVLCPSEPATNRE